MSTYLPVLTTGPVRTAVAVHRLPPGTGLQRYMWTATHAVHGTHHSVGMGEAITRRGAQRAVARAHRRLAAQRRHG